ncbi:AAA family ATPase [Fusobacterium russii]|uniref:AAA family ATPase n=1 Tax=Fusobacterium russii TaxID=854 RepID=UPI000399E916|nr:SMC family ATPase [Fusobacterium russii]
MIIRKINLENYRSHKNTTIELSGGINLILGENGKGKSSILEAIGIVLFDINDRTGKKIGKSFISYGETSATVEIIFLGNDGREYSIKNTFHSKKTNTAILKDLKTNEEIKNKEELRTKLNELCGIKKDYTDIYDNIIIAKQNEFINIFKDKPSEREKVFNKIFNTEIYSEMYAGILKDIEDKYSKEKEKLETEKGILSSNLKDESLIIRELAETESNKNELDKKLEETIKIKEQLSKKIKIFEEKERNIENYSKELSNKRENIVELKNNLKKNLSTAKRAKKSKKLVEANEKEYHLYISNEANLKNSRKILDNLKIKEDYNNRLINRNELLNLELKNNLEKLEANKKEIIEILNEKILLEKDLAENNKKRVEFINRGKFLKNILENVENIEKTLNDLERNKYSLERQLKEIELEFSLKKQEMLKISEENISKKLNNIQKIKEKISEIRSNILITQEKISTLEEAREKLTNKICPLLMENCENVKEKNVNSYFSEKILNLETESIKLKKYLDELESEIIEEKELNNLLVHFKFLETESQRLSKNIEDVKISIKKMELELENEKLSIRQILFKVNIKDKEVLKKEVQDITINLSVLNLDEKNKRLQTISRKKEELENENEAIVVINKKNEQEIVDNEKKIETGISYKILEIQEKIRNFEEEQKKLQKSYNIYLENINISNTIEEVLGDIRLSIRNIYNLRKLISKLVGERENLKIEIGKISIFDLREKFEEFNVEIIELSEKSGIAREKMENIKLILEEVRIQKKNVSFLMTKLKKIENKLYKTKIIRANIKGMGLKISKYMLESIAVTASISFNKITGRADRILWTNESYFENTKEKENKYAVYLVTKDRKIAFEHLSGGEQVAVAISLRETMTKYFSNSRFIILDEPTNNLDKERKKLLAEYMGEILNNLDQSIIVTHDNSFREMAETTIEL